MIDLMLAASVGLEMLAWFGSGNTLADELEAQAQSESKTISIRRGLNRNDSAWDSEVRGDNPSSTLFIHNGDGDGKDFLASGGIELQLGDGSEQDGSKWAMFEPFYYPDHFLIQYKDGRLERWDVGSNEGHCQPFQVRVQNNQVFRMDNNNVVPPGGRSNRGSCARVVPTSFTPPENPDSENDNSENPDSGGGSSSGVALAVGGIAVVGVALYLLSGGTADDISFAQDYDFSYAKDGDARYFYGARWEYQKDDWRAHWAAARANESENWRYASGLERTAGAWTASVNGESFGDEADAAFSLATSRTAGGWTLRANANADARWREFGAAFSHSVSASVARRFAKWTIAVSAAAHNSDNGAEADIVILREF